MIFNKKGQNITQPYVLVLLVVIVAVFSLSFFEFGKDVASDPNNQLDDSSLRYIYDRAGFELPDNISSSDTTNLFYNSDTDTEGNLKDFAIEFLFYREQSTGIRSTLQALWNLPIFFLSGFNLKLDSWSLVLNVINTLVYTLILFGIYRFLRGR